MSVRLHEFASSLFTQVEALSYSRHSLVFLQSLLDVVWYKNPFDYFNSPHAKQFDVYFQDDGSRQERFAPYSANSGFYFVRSNDRSKLLFRSMLYNGDLVFACRSHQQVLVSMLAEMNNYAGLTVKVLNRDEGK
jgi:hypothetical protein